MARGRGRERLVRAALVRIAQARTLLQHLEAR